ncbi:DUF2145 domain-containing protein [Variovorax terrae]|uniref:DUF2145 domain-containing protein n=1 Tax=Variovorax terrae TaxID=2923278 RepID=A0A9X2ANS1_9BURK|nr:DUF2145 domain-containing protein [Variovorax terrae]MCJ0764689.1 DUF2145 domain-containing protein [Variovorax terrae]
MKLHLWPVVVLAGLLALAPPAQAGRSCEAGKPTAQTIEKGLTLAERTMQALDAEHARSGAKLVVLARMGQNLSAYGLRYSHLGYAYKTPEGPWRVAHKLNTCGTAESALYRQGLGEFFLDDLWQYEAAWVVPTREVQERLYALLQDDGRTAALHGKAYSIVSYAWAQKYQQSNQWAIETLALAMEPAAGTRERAQAWLRAQGYEPGVLTIGPLTRLGGRIGSANVAFDDHPPGKRFSDRIETVTVDSVFAWLARARLGGAPVAIRL